MNDFDLSSRLRENRPMDLPEKLGVVYRLSLPGILAQISEILMQYIDAAMVGALGAAASASIGLVASSTWLFGGLLSGAAAGFSVQVAHAVGAGADDTARRIFKGSLVTDVLLSMVFMGLGVLMAQILPAWLGAEEVLWHDATMYFMIFSLFIPIRQINWLCMNMLQCSGDMKTPSLCSVLMCALDVVFNFLLIFPTRAVTFFGMELTVPGAGLGVAGAQLGTSLSVVVCAAILLYHVTMRSRVLSLKGTKGGWIPEKQTLRSAVRIGVPMALEQVALTGAQVVSTKIVAPLGTVAIAANSFAVTAESLCYMPGYGISSASTTLVGQAVGAKRKDLARSFAWLTTAAGVTVMTAAGIVMYFVCPYIFAFLTPDVSVQQLGTEVLRIELLAEPLFAASIVATGALRGAGDTLVPGILNLISIWGVRLTLAYFLSQTMGLHGCWIAMAVELCVRGILLLIRLRREKWLKVLA